MAAAYSSPFSQIFRNARSAFVSAGLTSLALNLLMLFTPLFGIEIYDRVLHSASFETLGLLVLILIAVLVTVMSLEIQRARMTNRLGEWIEEELLPVAARRAIENSAGLERSPVADVQALRAFVSGPGMTALLDLPWFPVFLLACFLLHPLIGWFSLATAVILFTLTVVTELRIGRQSEQVAAGGARISARFAEIARNADAAAGLGMTTQLIGDQVKAAEAMADDARRVADAATSAMSLSKMIRIGSQSLVMALAAYLVLMNEVSTGALMASSILMGRALMPLDGIIGGWRSFQGARAAYGRLSRAIGAPIQAARTTLPVPSGRLTVDSVSFHGMGGRPIVAGISLESTPGQILAIIGNSGSGKTTLARMLVGALTPSSGDVKLDGVSLRNWSEEQRCRHIGFLPQDAGLFAGTVKENIARFTKASDTDVIAAAHRAGCHELIADLPLAYETPLMEGGAPLSGGQRQRIALARALFGDPRLVVLDEPNSSLDGAGDTALVEAIKSLKANGVTVILVSHRPSILAVADLVAAMEGGRIVHVGPSQDVLRRLNDVAQRMRAVDVGASRAAAAPPVERVAG